MKSIFYFSPHDAMGLKLLSSKWELLFPLFLVWGITWSWVLTLQDASYITTFSFSSPLVRLEEIGKTHQWHIWKTNSLHSQGSWLSFGDPKLFQDPRSKSLILMSNWLKIDVSTFSMLGQCYNIRILGYTMFTRVYAGAKYCHYTLP